MKTRFALAMLALTAWACHAPSATQAAVVVVANKTAGAVHFTIVSGPGQSRDCTLSPGEVLPISLTRAIAITLSNERNARRYQLKGNTIYCFVGSGKKLELKQVGLTSSWGRPARPADDKKPEKSDEPPGKAEGVLVTIPVKILVDQAEPTVQRVWEKRLRKRIREASDILERHCRVRLKVVEVGTWESDPHLTTLSDLLSEFQGKVAVKPARLVIGFTGLLAAKKGDAALGTATAPLGTHILIREWKLRSEVERLEVLVQELGHFLGACQSPEADSVMRAKLGDGRANFVSFRIGFDPLNTLVLNLVAEELSRRPLESLEAVSPPTRRQLLAILTTLRQLSVDDTAAPRCIRLLGGTPSESLATRELPAGVVEGARSVVAAIVATAEQNERRPRRTGDTLAVTYFQTAAGTSRRLPAEHAVSAYLLGVAIALDRSALLHAMPLRGVPWGKIETAAQRAHRLRVLGEPTMHGRARLLQNFVASAGLITLLQEQAISPGGILEELLRVRGDDRFRFEELSANLAGVTFALQIDTSPSLLDELATSFRIADYVLAPAKTPAGLTRDEFLREYGSIADQRFLREEDALRKRLLALPGYQLRSASK
ncbi:MAG TPA: hypothetical protein VMG10_18380 [Gemmataceae bacterium]|nr:hypothetical protein [Gemmataceae bacterium]